MLTPHPIIRTSAAPRRTPTARLIRRPVDTVRLKAVLRSEAYAILLRLEVMAEEARDALRAEDDTAAIAMARELLAGACLVGRGLQRLRARL